MVNEQDQPPPNPSNVDHITIKAPEFIENAPTAWFSILEAQFQLRGVTVSTTKYYHALSQLPSDVVAHIPHDVFTQQNYETLKTAVVSSYERSKPEMLEKLMSQTTLSGRPSLYLQEMRTLASKISVADDIIRHKFLKALPNTVSAALASHSAIDLTALGKLADDLMSYFDQHSVNTVQSHASRPNFNNNRPTGTRSDQNRNSNSSLPFNVRPFSKDQRTKVCRAHIYFAEKAKTCKPWCHWPDKTRCNIAPSSRPASRSSSPVNQLN